MKKVNLLPVWYTQRQRERQMLRTRILMLICLGVMMVAWKVSSNARLAHLETLATELREQREIVRNEAADVHERQAYNAHLEKRAAAYRELGHPAPVHELLQQIENELLPGMALTDVTMDVRQDPIQGAGNVGDRQNPPRYRQVATFCIEGIAPRDEQVAQMVDRLTHNPVFTDVNMNYTRGDVLRGFAVRRFQIRLSVDLERLPAGDPSATLQAMREHDAHEG